MSVLRKKDEPAQTASRRVTARRCWDFLCPFCPHDSHREETYFQVQRLASLSHDVTEPEIFHVVFTLPPLLQRVIQRHPPPPPRPANAPRENATEPKAKSPKGGAGKGIEAFRDAAWTAIMRTLGHEDDEEGRKALGTIFNFHAAGDTPKEGPFPTFFPHLDVLILAAKSTPRGMERITRLDVKILRRRYVELLRDKFRPLLRDLHEHVELSNLETAQIQVSRGTNPKSDAPWVIRGFDHVRAVTSYSCRPIIDMAHARLAKKSDASSSAPTILYAPKGGQYTVRQDAQTMIDHLVHMKTWLSGAEMHSTRGVLSRDAYATACSTHGRKAHMRKKPNEYALDRVITKDAATKQYHDPGPVVRPTPRNDDTATA